MYPNKVRISLPAMNAHNCSYIPVDNNQYQGSTHRHKAVHTSTRQYTHSQGSTHRHKAVHHTRKAVHTGTRQYTTLARQYTQVQGSTNRHKAVHTLARQYTQVQGSIHRYNGIVNNLHSVSVQLSNVSPFNKSSGIEVQH